LELKGNSGIGIAYLKNGIGIDKFGIDKVDVELELCNWNRVELE